MALKSFFTVQHDMLRLFIAELEQTVRVVQVAADMQPLLMKALAGLDSDTSPHLMLCMETPFENPKQFFDGLVSELRGELARWEAPLENAGFKFQVRPEDLSFLAASERFVAYAGALADAFPETFGALVLILAPERVADAAKFRAAIGFLAKETPTPWLKYIVVDDRQSPALANMEEENPNVWVQTFHIAPDEIESQAKQDLDRGGLDPMERRQYLALLGGFAYARRQYDEAQRLQHEWLDALGHDGAPSETANACYNLGNTQLARKDYAAAEATYGRALELALDHNLGALAPMVLTNLGVALYHQERLEDALQAFTVARQTCQAQGLRPAEAHVLDCLARTHEAGGRFDEAGAAWREALAVYDSMSSETFAQAREGGRADILEKLERVSAAAKKAAEDAKLAERSKAGWFNWRRGA